MHLSLTHEICSKRIKSHVMKKLNLIHDSLNQTVLKNIMKLVIEKIHLKNSLLSLMYHLQFSTFPLTNYYLDFINSQDCTSTDVVTILYITCTYKAVKQPNINEARALRSLCPKVLVIWFHTNKRIEESLIHFIS